ncbi:hypothetical protein BD310DRAFT_826347 [Dichomitus squalens]|uniref:Uncharacterized protein n=1 Tax=Dichomitus squalens TaxID=114155 RepID=A0A4Q9PLU3_9APHY|nr:hypothetical protein BD310DRAFT_826347 [Dichomitus squalens]
MSTNASKMLLATLPPVPSLNSTFGAMLIGTFTGLVLYGLSLHQTLHYFLTYTGDTRLLKLMILCLSFYIRRVYLLGYGYQYVAIPATLFMLSGTASFTTACTVEAFSKTTFVAFSRVVVMYFIAVLTVLNSRRSLMSSTASSEGDFGTFGLSAPQQKSVRLPASARLDILRGPSGSDGPVIDIGKWQTPAAEQTIDRYKVRDGDSANLHEDV